MDPIMMTVDVLGAITTLCSLAYERIDAAAALPEKVATVRRTVEAVEGAIEGVQDDRSTKACLASIRIKLKEMVEVLGELGGKEAHLDTEGIWGTLSRCVCLIAKGHNVLNLEAQLDSLNQEIRDLIGELVKATQLHSYAHRASGVLKEEGARKMWDKHFHNKREVSMEELEEALEVSRPAACPLPRPARNDAPAEADPARSTRTRRRAWASTSRRCGRRPGRSWRTGGGARGTARCPF